MYVGRQVTCLLDHPYSKPGFLNHDTSQRLGKKLVVMLLDPIRVKIKITLLRIPNYSLVSHRFADSSEDS